MTCKIEKSPHVFDPSTGSHSFATFIDLRNAQLLASYGGTAKKSYRGKFMDFGQTYGKVDCNFAANVLL